MPNLLVAQLDYIQFFFGLVLFLLGSVCVSMARVGPLPTPWWLLGAFALTLGVAEWLGILQVTGLDPGWLGLLRTTVTAASFLLLLEFVRRTTRLLQGHTVGPWIHVALIAAVAVQALTFGLAHVEVAVRLFVATPALAWTSGLFLLAFARTENLGGGAGSQRARFWGGLIFGAFGLAAGLVVPRAPFLPGAWPTDEAFLGRTGIPIQLVRGLLVCGMALSVWVLAVSFDRRGALLRKRRLLFWVMASSIAAMVGAGWLFTDWLGRLYDQDVREDSELSASQIHEHLADELSVTDGASRSLAALVARHRSPGGPVDSRRLDGLVDSIALASDGLVAYVLDPAGTAIAASDRDLPGSFLGKSCASHPYFQAALGGVPGRFLWKELAGGMAGYYSAQPVRGVGGGLVAVTVIKRTLAASQFGPAGVDESFVVSPDGLVLVADRPGPEARHLWPPPEPASPDRGDLRNVPPPTPAILDHAVMGTEWVSRSGQREIAVRRSIPVEDWSLVVLKSAKPNVANRLLGIVITLLLCTVVLTYFVAMQRQFAVESRIADKRREAEGRAREYARQADTDALTGLLNRLGFNGAFSREFERALRYGQPLSVVILDLDHFKQVNDRHGHAVGDQVLVGAARLLEASVRESDVVARWGGEEFVVVAPMTASIGARQLAEKLRARLEATRLGPQGAVTGSFGAAELRPGESIEALLHRADQALYRAKNGGRNRVECAGANAGDEPGHAAAPAAAGQARAPDASAYTGTGFALFDREHRALGEALDDFVRKVQAQRPEEIETALRSIIEAVLRHFGHEERMMKAYDYPLRKRHEESHALFVGDARSYLETLDRDGLTTSFRRWAVGRLVEWFRFHIIAHDLELGRFLAEARAARGRADPGQGGGGEE